MPATSLIPTILVEQLPITVPNSPVDGYSTNSPTPQLQFIGSDKEGEDLEYNFQLDVHPNEFEVKLDTTAGIAVASGGTITQSITVGNNNNRYLICFVFCRGAYATGIVRNSQNFTLIAGYQLGADEYVQAWKLADPTVGAYNVVATLNTTQTGAIAIGSYYNVGSAAEGGHTTGSGVNLDTVSNTNKEDQVIVAGLGLQTGGQLAVPNPFLKLRQAAQNVNMGYALGDILNPIENQKYSWYYSNEYLVDLAVILTPSVTLSKFSKTDAGFVNITNGGDSHPFTSGNTIGYTPQSSLPDGLYYWRARAIDGAGQYGQWSTPRAIYIATSQTITGQSRIAATVAKTLAGISRIFTTTTKTLTGVAKVIIVGTKTLVGKSRITAATPKTIAGKANIISLMSSLFDTFSDGAIDAAKWNTYDTTGSTSVETGGNIVLTPKASTAGAEADCNGDVLLRSLIGSYAHVQVKQICSGNVSTMFFVEIDYSNALRISVNGADGNLTAFTIIADVYTQIGSGVTYNSTTHAWWRIRESGGTCYFETSPSGLAGSWTSFASCANPFALTAVFPSMVVYEDGSTASPGSAIFDNFNITPVQTPKTITGVARVMVSTLKTIVGQARLNITTPKTVSGQSKITITSHSDITGKGYINTTSATNKTIAAVARIALITPKTLAGISRVTIATAKTLAGQARLKVSTLKTIVGQSRITKVTAKILTGLARLTASAAKNLTGISRITIATAKTLSGLSRISETSTNKQIVPNSNFELGSGNSFTGWTIGVTPTSTVTEETSDVYSGSRAVKMTIDSANNYANITNSAGIPCLPLTKYTFVVKIKSTRVGSTFVVSISDHAATPKYLQQDGVTWSTTIDRFTLTLGSQWRAYSFDFTTYAGQTTLFINEIKRNGSTNSVNIIDGAEIWENGNPNIYGFSRITGVAAPNAYGKARITISTLKTLSGLSRITAAALKTISGLARITIATGRALAGQARIVAKTLKTQVGRARVTAVAARLLTGLARITSAATKSLVGLSRVQIFTQKALSGLSRLKVSALKVVTGISRVTAVAIKSIDGRFHITVIITKTITGLADIAKMAQQNIDGVGRLLAPTKQTITGKAKIKGLWGLFRKDRQLYIANRSHLMDLSGATIKYSGKLYNKMPGDQYN